MMPLLDEDGWELESTEERHADAPRSFGIPSREERTSLASGSRVKLLFLFMNEDDGKPIIDCERMWVTIVSVREGRYMGHLRSLPATSQVIDIRCMEKLSRSGCRSQELFVHQSRAVTASLSPRSRSSPERH